MDAVTPGAPSAWVGDGRPPHPDCVYQVGRPDTPSTPEGVLDRLDRVMDPVCRQLVQGRGYALLRGIPVADLGDSQLDALAWAASARLGTVLPQDPSGVLVARVTNTAAGADAATRGYRTNRSLPFHVDSCDVAALLCVRGAHSGGTTVLASAASAYEVLSREHPEAVRLLESPLPVDRRWEGTPDALYFDSPVFLRHPNGQIWGRYERELIEGGFDPAGRKLTRDVVEALDALDAVLESPRLHVRVSLRPGDLLLVNNNLLVHRRDGYRDGSEERLLLRTWIDLGEVLDRPPGFQAPDRFRA
jgi:alpha-ketoglutarate-dependent taurine dioxygenase